LAQKGQILMKICGTVIGAWATLAKGFKCFWGFWEKREAYNRELKPFKSKPNPAGILIGCRP